MYHLSIVFQNFSYTVLLQPLTAMEVGVQGQTLVVAAPPQSNLGRVCTPRFRSDNSHSATKTVTSLLAGDFGSALFGFKT